MIKKKKFKLLWPKSNCCLKKFLDLELISKYGSISVIFIMILSQVFNIIMQESSYTLAFLSMIINTLFLIVILTKLEIIKISILEKYLNTILKIIIFIFILNFFGYLTSSLAIYNYVLAPISFLGAYFVFLLLLNKN
jgi:hypothetical protein